MKEYIFLSLNILFSIFLFSYLYDPVLQYTPAPSTIQCLTPQGSTKAICAQCIVRQPNSKGLLLQSQSQFAVLKIRQKQAFLTCKEFVHFIDYSNPLGLSIVLEHQPSIMQLISQLNAIVTVQNIGKKTVAPEFEELVVFGWYNNNEQKGVAISHVSEEYNNSIFHFFFYVLNVSLLVIVIGKVLERTDILGNTKYGVIILVVLLEAVTSQYLIERREFILYLIRVLTFSLSLQRVQVRTTYVWIYMVSGFLLALHPLTLIAYSYAGWLLMLIGGWEKINVKSIWRYLAATHLILALNYLLWYMIFEYQADSGCRIIELSQLIFNLIGLSLLQDRKVFSFREYRPSDPEQKAIYLSGYDEEEEIHVRN